MPRPTFEQPAIQRGPYLGTRYPCLDGLTSKGATEEQQTPSSKKPDLLCRAKRLFQLWVWRISRPTASGALSSDSMLCELEPESVWIIPVGVQERELLEPLLLEKPFGIGLRLYQEAVVALLACGCARGG